jgi:hypothetical protein
MMEVPDEKIRWRIQHNILAPIDLLIEHGHAAAAAMLILAGIDTMANVNRPECAEEGSATDFKDWVDQYFDVGRRTLPSVPWAGPPISSAEWFKARCVMLHEFRIRSEGSLRSLGWVITDKSNPRNIIVFTGGEMKADLRRMRAEFAKGIEMFLAKELAGSRQTLIRERLDKLVIQYQVDKRQYLNAIFGTKGTKGPEDRTK